MSDHLLKTCLASFCGFSFDSAPPLFGFSLNADPTQIRISFVVEDYITGDVAISHYSAETSYKFPASRRWVLQHKIHSALSKVTRWIDTL